MANRKQNRRRAHQRNRANGAPASGVAQTAILPSEHQNSQGAACLSSKKKNSRPVAMYRLTSPDYRSWKAQSRAMAPSMTGLLVPLPEGFVGWDEDESRSAVIFVDNGKPYDVEKDLPEAWLVEKVRDLETMAFWPRCTEYFPSMDVNWHRVKGNMPRYDDHGEEWHHKVGFTKEEYGIYQGSKIMRLCHPLSQRHTKVPDTIVPGLKDGFDPGKWPIAQSYDDTLCHKLASKLVRWPSMPNIVTQAPFVLNDEYKFARPFDQIRKPLFKVMLVPELAERVLLELKQTELKNFALACTTTFDIVSTTVDHRDACRGLMPTSAEDIYFQKALDEGKCTAADLGRRKLGKMLLVTEFRHALSVNEKGDAWRPRLRLDDHFLGLIDLVKSLYGFGGFVQHLQLHRVQFLDERIARMLLMSDCMPKLRYLAIMHCELLHFGNTVELLEIMEKRNAGEHPVESFDFFPRLHQGPNDTFRMGSFGVTWQDAGVSTAQGVLSTCLWQIFPKAEDLGFDFVSPTSSFRLWLEQTPAKLWSVPRAINFFYQMRDEGLAMADQGREDSGHWHEQLFGILHGEVALGFRKEAKMFEMHRCIDCGIEYPRHLIWSFNGCRATCKACCLRMVLEDARDHYLPGKRFVVTRYLWNPTKDEGQGTPFRDDATFITDLEDLVVKGDIKPRTRYYLPGDERPPHEVTSLEETLRLHDKHEKRQLIVRQQNAGALQASWLYRQHLHNRSTPWHGPVFSQRHGFFVHPTLNPIEAPGTDKLREEDQCVHAHDLNNPTPSPFITAPQAVMQSGGGLPQIQWHNPNCYEPSESWDDLLARDRAVAVTPDWRRMLPLDRRRGIEYFLATLPTELVRPVTWDGVSCNFGTLDTRDIKKETVERIFVGAIDHDFKSDPDGVRDTAQINWSRAINWDGQYTTEEAFDRSTGPPARPNGWVCPMDTNGGMPPGFW